MKLFRQPVLWLLLLGAAGYLVADLRVNHGPASRLLGDWILRRRAVATLGSTPIPLPEMEQALRRHLFRHGLDWDELNEAARDDARGSVLRGLIDLELLHREAMASNLTPTARCVTAEIQDFIREFDPPSEYARRLGLQHETEGGLIRQIGAQQADQEWLRSQIRSEPVTAAEVAGYCEAHLAELSVPETWQAQHLFLSGHEQGKPHRMDEILALHQQLITGASTLEALISEHSEDARTKLQGGALGWFSERRMPREFVQAIRPLAVGQLSAPFRTKLGWHIVRLTGHHPARSATQNETGAEVTALLEHQRRSQGLNVYFQALRTRFAEPITIHQAVLDTVQPAGYSKQLTN